MSETFGVKVSKEDKKILDGLINRYAKLKGLRKGEALLRVVKTYFVDESYEGDSISITISEAIQEVNCPYFKVVNDENFACFEVIHKKKGYQVLGLVTDAVLVIKMCKSCQDRKVELHNEKTRNELRKANIRKLEEFMRNFTQLTESGTEVMSFMCMGDVGKSSLIFSYDGLYLSCPLLKDMDEDGIEFNQPVNIENACQKKINRKTGLTPCEYLTAIPHIVSIDEILKDVVVPPQDAWEGTPFRLLEDATNQDRDKTIDAEFELFDEDNQPVKEKE